MKLPHEQRKKTYGGAYQIQVFGTTSPGGEEKDKDKDKDDDKSKNADLEHLNSDNEKDDEKNDEDSEQDEE